MPNTVQVQTPTYTTGAVQAVYVEHCKYEYRVHSHVHAPTYNRCVAQAVHAKHCTRIRTVCTTKHTILRTNRRRAQAAHAKHCIRSYTFSVHTQAHWLTYIRRIAQAAHVKHGTRTRTVCTSKHTGECTIGASLRLNTVQVQVQCAHYSGKINN